MDWNNDGKHDLQDHIFYNNLISDDKKSPSQREKGEGGKNYSSPSAQATGAGWLFILFALWVFSLFFN
ncbi:MAG: hypothetical protein E7370_03350 [Clostridiales bacterium]|nr:hypothetical protein [Clostridiales bacterium]